MGGARFPLSGWVPGSAVPPEAPPMVRFIHLDEELSVRVRHLKDGSRCELEQVDLEGLLAALVNLKGTVEDSGEAMEL